MRAGSFLRNGLYRIPFVGETYTLMDLTSPCGYGFCGAYYGEEATHQGQNQYAIDFVRYTPGIPYWTLVPQTQAIAAHAGVAWIYSRGGYMDLGAGNEVYIEWLTDAQKQTFIATKNPVQWQGAYQSRYLHLDSNIFISSNMLLPQGGWLAFMDSSGDSGFPHLHFSWHDKSQGWQTIPPTLDGRFLDYGDGGSCVASTNVPFP
jgi:hypothetical protein